MELNVIDFINAIYIKLHKLLFKYAQNHCIIIIIIIVNTFFTVGVMYTFTTSYNLINER